MKELIVVYSKDTAYQTLTAIYPLTVLYDAEISQYFVRYENCVICKDGKTIETKGFGETINDACVNYISLINLATMSPISGKNTYHFNFMKAR